MARRSELNDTLCSVFGVRPEQINPGLSRADVPSWDSLKQMDLIVSLEERFDIILEVEDIVRMTNVAEIESVLAEKGVVLEP